ncbi:MAG TPA: hypothetical protein VIP09_02165 [Dehalococcoidia bacterium]
MDLQAYVTLAASIIGLCLLVGSATPKGFRAVVVAWLWLNKHVLNTDLYAEIHRINERHERIDDDQNE